MPKDSADAARVLDGPMGSGEKTTDVETALLVKLQNLKKADNAPEKKKVTAVVLLDMSMALDSIKP